MTCCKGASHSTATGVKYSIIEMFCHDTWFISTAFPVQFNMIFVSLKWTLAHGYTPGLRAYHFTLLISRFCDGIKYLNSNEVHFTLAEENPYDSTIVHWQPCYRGNNVDGHAPPSTLHHYQWRESQKHLLCITKLRFLPHHLISLEQLCSPSPVQYSI